jgi:hypothetical protein
MKGFVGSIEKAALKNKTFRTVLYTAKNCQLVVMSLKPGEDIGAEVHQLDQLLHGAPMNAQCRGCWFFGEWELFAAKRIPPSSTRKERHASRDDTANSSCPRAHRGSPYLGL